MTRVLILLAMPEQVQAQYQGPLRKAFPDLTIDLVGHHSQVDPFIAEADVLLTFGPMLGDQAEEILGRAANLKWVQALGTGVDNIADIATLRPEAVLTNIHGLSNTPVSEAALMAMLALSRDVPRVLQNQAQRAWARWPMRLLDGKTVGIFGVGAIAEELAPKCKALGMTVAGISSATRQVPGFDRMHRREELARVVGELDFLLLLTPYSPETHQIINAAVLAAMKPTAYLINLARGGIVDEGALLEVLRERRIAGAALDVFATEPLPAAHPFWGLDNLILTPHLAGFCDVYAERAMEVIEENFRRFLAGKPQEMINLVAR